MLDRQHHPCSKRRPSYHHHACSHQQSCTRIHLDFKIYSQKDKNKVKKIKNIVFLDLIIINAKIIQSTSNDKYNETNVAIKTENYEFFLNVHDRGVHLQLKVLELAEQVFGCSFNVLLKQLLFLCI